MQLIFMGAPGSGKGTQAAKLHKEKGLKHLSTGDLLRAEIKKDSDLGQKVKSILDAGELVNDHVVLELLQVNTDMKSDSHIFDGFPRTLEQAKLLDEHILKDAKSKAFFFDMPTEILVERLTARRLCKECGAIYNIKSNPPKVDGVCDQCGKAALYQRDDDKEDVIQNRMDVYNSTIGPVIDYYDEKGYLVRLDASSSMDDVYESILKELV